MIQKKRGSGSVVAAGLANLFKRHCPCRAATAEVNLLLRRRQGEVKSYHLKGTIAGTDATRGEVQINSEAIPGFMDAMVMPYKLKDPGILQDLHTGDHLTATLLVPDNGPALIDQIVVTEQAQPDYKPTTSFHVPTVGDVLPDFTFTNQSGKQVTLKSFRGQDPADHLHLHPLPAVRLLPAHEPKFRCHRQIAACRPRALREDPSAQHQLRSGV